MFIEQASYNNRIYRRLTDDSWAATFEVTVGETNLYIAADCDLSKTARRVIVDARAQILAYARSFPEFLDSLSPIPAGPDPAPVVREMLEASRLAGVGPMAAVAGAIAEAVGRALLQESEEVAVENGGDIFVASRRTIKIGILAGDSAFSGKLALRLEPGIEGIGVCTSSGTVGPSKSFGSADAAVVVARSAALADAAATCFGNMLERKEDIEPALEKVCSIEGVKGALAIIGQSLGAKGSIELASM
jgi:hypothetical protein